MYNLLNKIMGKYKKNFNRNYYWGIVSYITYPYYLKFYKRYMLYHQNRYTSLILLDVFKDLQLNFMGINYNNFNLNLKIDKAKVKIVFGIEPNFVNFSKLYNKALKIYFATGAYFEHQNMMILKRTEEVNKKKNSMLKYIRLVHPHNSVELADYIIQIGSNYTIETYPKKIRNKIYLVRQNTFEFLKYNEKLKKEKYKKNVFLWFGGKGAILKGLDLVLDYFSKNSDYILHVVGPVEKDFQSVYEKELFYTNNIYFHGPLNINSKKLIKIAMESSYIILPSASEGLPGSVLNMMRLGLIPIVSKYAAFNEINKLGYIIKDLSIESIHESVNRTKDLTSKDYMNLFRNNSDYVIKNFNSLTFFRDLKKHLETIMKENYS